MHKHTYRHISCYARCHHDHLEKYILPCFHTCHIRIHTYIHTYTHTHMNVATHTYIHTYIHTYMYCVYLLFYIIIHVIHAYIHTYIHTYTCRHTGAYSAILHYTKPQVFMKSALIFVWYMHVYTYACIHTGVYSAILHYNHDHFDEHYLRRHHRYLCGTESEKRYYRQVGDLPDTNTDKYMCTHLHTS